MNVIIVYRLHLLCSIVGWSQYLTGVTLRILYEVDFCTIRNRPDKPEDNILFWTQNLGPKFYKLISNIEYYDSDNSVVIIDYWLDDKIFQLIYLYIYTHKSKLVYKTHCETYQTYDRDMVITDDVII